MTKNQTNPCFPTLSSNSILNICNCTSVTQIHIICKLCGILQSICCPPPTHLIINS
jgi:hypothetical protein